MKEDMLLNLMMEYIKTYPTVLPQYKYEHEEAMNPAYCDIDHCSLLSIGEKRIWALRGDLIFALGIKNTHISQGNTRLIDKIDESLHHHINFEDRFGHPSLAMPDGEYNGSVIYAGWIHQHSNHLEVFVGSGRYYNKTLSSLQRKFLEHYIFLKLIDTYGKQNIVFMDYLNELELEYFLCGVPFPSAKSKRLYSQKNAEMPSLLILLLISSLVGPRPKFNILLGAATCIMLLIFSEAYKVLCQLAMQKCLNFLPSVLITNAEQPKALTQDKSEAAHVVSLSMFKPESKPANDDGTITTNSIRLVE